MTYKKYRFINFIKLYWIEIILSVLSLSIILYMLFGSDYKEVLISILISDISAIFLLSKYKLEKKKIFHELFSYFNTRYDKLNDNMNRIKDNEPIIIPVNFLNKLDINKNDMKEIRYYEKNIIYDYLNLCGEEYYWLRQGMIQNEVWKSWEKGISYFLESNRVMEIVIEEKSKVKIEDKKNKLVIYDNYYGFLYSDVVNIALEKYYNCMKCKNIDHKDENTEMV